MSANTMVYDRAKDLIRNGAADRWDYIHDGIQAAEDKIPGMLKVMDDLIALNSWLVTQKDELKALELFNQMEGWTRCRCGSCRVAWVNFQRLGLERDR